MVLAGVVVKALVALAAFGTLAQCRFLADPSADAAPADDSADVSSNSTDDTDAQIAALAASMDGLTSQVAAAKTDAIAKGAEVVDDFTHHCKKAEKERLDKMEISQIPAEKSADKATLNKKKALGGSQFDKFNLALEASNQKSVMENEEFLLGLLMHKDWSYEQQMDAICDLAGDNPMLIRLYKQHSKTETLAVQLAKLMDEQSKNMPATKAPPLKLEGDSVASILAKVR